MNINQISHSVLAVVAVVGIIVLQALGKGQADIFALLGGVAGFSGQAATLHSLFSVDKDDEK